MGKKLTYEYVYNYFKEQGCELLEDEYKNSQKSLQYICKCGYITKTSFSNFKRYHNCKNCVGMKKQSFEYVYNYFKEQGCELLETEYINTSTNMRYICKCGNESFINFNNFQKGVRCRNCCSKKLNNAFKLNIDFVKSYINKYNYICLFDDYINKHKKLKLLCDKNHECYISFNNFQRGRRCKKCFQQRDGELHHSWINDRSRRIRSNYLSFNKRNKKELKKLENYNIFLNTKNNEIDSKYQIDHIFPRIAFIDNNLDIKYDKKIIKEICNSIDNLRIITKRENQSKGRKYNNNEFLKWFNNKIKENNIVLFS